MSPFTGTAERLVVLSPFIIDLHEVTVAEMRGANWAPYSLCPSPGTRTTTRIAITISMRPT